MKKIMFFILFALLGFLLLGWILSSKHTQIQITKEITVDASLQEVFDMVKYLRNFPKWSPFLEADPAQEYEIKGTDGQIGAQYHWSGNKGKDLGYQEITKIEDLAFIGMQCHIQKPFSSQPTFAYSFTPTGQNVTVKQVFTLQSSRVDAYFMWLFGVKKEIAQTNERGLALLKQQIEN